MAANAQHFDFDDDEDGQRSNANGIRETENKHEHYDLYQKYLALGEELLEDELERKLPDDTSLLDFYTTLERMSEEEAVERVPIEIFNLLNTFLSFEAFRDQMMDYKRASRARRMQTECKTDGEAGPEQRANARRDAAVTVEDLIQINPYKL